MKNIQLGLVLLVLLVAASFFEEALAKKSKNTKTKTPTTPTFQKSGFLSIKDGYFFDVGLQQYWFAHGIAYQDWIADLGEWQTDEQIDYDLREIRKIGANSVRIDFVWKHIEVQDNVFEWDRYDRIVDAAERNGMRLFPLVGYQWPPSWFPGVMFTEGNNVDPGYYTKHPPAPAPAPPFVDPAFNYTQKWVSDIMSFENPAGVAQYEEFLRAVGERYKDRTGIGGWIVGNEYGYIGLWSYRQDGYDDYCVAAFRTWCATRYGGDINAANAKWGTAFPSFETVEMPLGYDRNNKLWADLVLWREGSVADFIAKGAEAIRAVDTNHMLSYSTVGMIWGPEDWRYHAENTEKIAKACASRGAALDFMSINNYPNGMTGDELRSGKWGFKFAKWKMALPVMLSEVGYTSTENLFPVAADQGLLLTNALWESVIGCGAIGMHVFTWPFRQWLTPREQGFGIVSANRIPTQFVEDVSKIFRLVEQHRFSDKWLPGSHDPKADIAFYWTDAGQQMYNRYQANMQAIWGPLERLGFEPRFMSRDQLFAGEYRDVRALILPRNQRLDAGDLQFILNTVIPSGVSVFADADLPGMQDYYINPQPDFDQMMASIFGVQVIEANTVEDKVVEYTYGVERIRVDARPLMNFGTTIVKDQTDLFWTWKYHKLRNIGGTQISSVTFAKENWSQEYAGLVIKDHGVAKAAISGFAMGELSPSGVAPWEQPDKIPWKLHWNWFNALLISPQGFGITPAIPTVGSPYMMADLRTSGNISGDGVTTFVTVLNWSDDTTETCTITIPQFVGMTIVNILTNQILLINSPDGVITITLEHNQFAVLKGSPGAVQPSVIINKCPGEVTPMRSNYQVSVDYMLGGNNPSSTSILLELVDDKGTVYSSSTATPTADVGAVVIPIYVTSPTVSAAKVKKGKSSTSAVSTSTTGTYISTEDGGSYKWRVTLQTSGKKATVLATTQLTVYVSFAIKPLALPSTSSVKPGATITTTLSWEHVQPLSRVHAFPGRILVYYSAKTAAVDWAHGEKVGAVVDMLNSLGYQRAYLGPLSEALKREAPLYFMLSDDMACNYSLCGTNGLADATIDGALYNLNAYYISTYFQTIILPGVWVMNDVEVNNLVYFLNNVPDAKVISTEGGVGRLREDLTPGEDRLAGVFGMGPTPAYALTNYDGTLTVRTDLEHLITRDYTKVTTTPATPATPAKGKKGKKGKTTVVVPPTNTTTPTGGITNPMSIISRIGSSWVWPEVLPTAVPLGTVSFTGDTVARPALIVNKFSPVGTTFLFNFDPTIYHQMETLLRPITSGLDVWFTLGQYAAKVDWRVVCTSTSGKKGTTTAPTGSYNPVVVATTSEWVLTTIGNATVTLKVPSTKARCAASRMAFEAYVYPWENHSFDARLGYYSSADLALSKKKKK